MKKINNSANSNISKKTWEEIKPIMSELDWQEISLEKFKGDIACGTTVICRKRNAQVFFENYEIKSHVLGISMDDPLLKEKDCYDIGHIFTCAYAALKGHMPHIIKSTYDIYNCEEQMARDVALLEDAAQKLREVEPPVDYMDTINQKCKVLDYAYGMKTFASRDVEESQGNGKKGKRKTVAIVNYKCENLFQLCGALLDHLFRYEIKEEYGFVERFALGKCERCGDYFILENRNARYCSYKKDENSNKEYNEDTYYQYKEGEKSCAELQEIGRKKKVSEKVTPAEQKAKKIIKRINAKKNYLGDDGMASDKLKEKYKNLEFTYDRLLKLFREHNQLEKEGSRYIEWIEEATEMLKKQPDKGNDEIYNIFYKWLQERSTNGIH